MKHKFFNFFHNENSFVCKKIYFFEMKAHKSGLFEAVSSRKRLFWENFMRICQENA
jgi:hypothetical protein